MVEVKGQSRNERLRKVLARLLAIVIVAFLLSFLPPFRDSVYVLAILVLVATVVASGLFRGGTIGGGL